MSPALSQLRARLRDAAAQGGMAIDLPAYQDAGRDPLDPVLLGSGSLTAPLGVFGRDPGRSEVAHNEPFIGAGGQLIRAALHRRLRGGDPPDFDAALDVGRAVFWGNTVPYKPVGNKPWPVRIQRRFAPVVCDLLVNLWSGHDLLVCGTRPFQWFGLADPALKPALEAFWAREDRYSASLAITLAGKPLRLHPLPHPSPANAAWFKKFPALIDARLEAMLPDVPDTR
jgi:uracil-DNA glycosylase